MLSSLDLMSPKIPLLVISGATATGKTSLAVSLAKKFNGRLISADSRQIYRGLDIGTGKDHPPGFPISLIDIRDPNQVFSANDFKNLAQKQIKKNYRQGRLSILVGGTGYYIKSLLFPISISVPPHPFFRQVLNHFPLYLLQLFNLILNHKQYLSLNHSEKHNPHRLIRKLEIMLFPSKKELSSSPAYNYLHLCLTAPLSHLYKRIDQRIRQRLDAGLLAEIENLLKKYQWSDPGLNTLSYKEFKPYFKRKNKKDFQMSCKKWQQDEHAYARRQLTWFRKQKNLHFFNIKSASFPQDINNLISKWYNKL
jgi:tRNA dimethylallyltransferase